MKPVSTQWRQRAPTIFWAFFLAGLVVWSAVRLGVFSLNQSVVTSDGPVWLPNAFAGVDHPFHIARAEILRRSVLDGEILRWIGQHQGGYPVEFYPLGVAWLEVGVWALSFGLLSIPQVHTIVIALIFLLPGLAYLLLARQDGWSPRVAVLALAFHLAVPGDWWHGGYTELVQWGLVTNVGGAVAGLFFLAWLTRYVNTGTRLALVGAVIAAATAVYANPRSLIALVVIGVGVWLAAVAWPGDHRPRVATAGIRVTLVAMLAALVAAPELLSLARYSGLYQFVRYERYADLNAFFQSATTAVSAPVFALAVLGTGVSLIAWRPFAARSVAVTLALYVVVTSLLVGEAGSLISQLEPTRLMPFQRLLVAYLAAVAIERGVCWLSRRAPDRARLIADVAIAVLVLGLLVGQSSPALSSMPVPAQTDPMSPALYPVERTAQPQFADLREAVLVADRDAAPGTSLLVIGSALSWHQRLWSPLWTDRPLMYDNWLWFWQDAHAGPPGYDWERGHHYPEPALALDRDYLDRHGIGAVVVTGPAAERASTLPWLTEIRAGVYAVYLVQDPVPVVTFAGQPATSLEIGNHEIEATGESEGGVATFRRNWFPRWQATVNGQPAAVTRMADGYMEVPIPPGAVTLTLTYATNPGDWLARVICLAGVAGTLVVVIWQRQRDRLTAAAATSSAAIW